MAVTKCESTSSRVHNVRINVTKLLYYYINYNYIVFYSSKVKIYIYILLSCIFS